MGDLTHDVRTREAEKQPSPDVDVPHGDLGRGAHSPTAQVIVQECGAGYLHLVIGSYGVDLPA